MTHITGCRTPRSRVIAALATSAMLITGCGSSNTKSDSSSANSSSSAGNSSSSASGTADVAAAKADMATYVGKASAFPVGTPLAKHLPSDSVMAYLQCPTATCALAGKAVAGAAKALGLKYHPVQAGASSTDVTAAMNAIIALKPKIVIAPGLNPGLICSQLKTLTSSGVGVGTFGMVGAEACGVKAAINSGASVALGGRLMADWVVANKGAAAKVAMYVSSELAFSSGVQQGFKAQMAKLCSACSVRIVKIPLASYGSTASSMMVSDVQRNPGTNTMVFDNEEAAIGLPSALKTANLTSLSQIGWGPEPANLSDIKAGGISAGIGVDVPTMIWMTADAATRIATGQPLVGGERQGVPPVQVLGQADITFDPANGFVPYPDFVQRFSRLWAGH